MAILDNSMFYKLFISLVVSFYDSSIINLFKRTANLDFSRSEMINFVIKHFLKILKKLSFARVFLDSIINFCLYKPSRKITLILMFFILTNYFLRRNFFADIFYIPLLSILFMILTINLLTHYMKIENRRFLVYILLSFFFIKFSYSILSPNFFLAEDELSSYDEFSWRITTSWFKDSPVYYDKNLAGFTLNGIQSLNTEYVYKFVAIIYYFFGHNFLIARLFYLFLHIFSGVLICLIAKSLFNERTALILTILYFTSMTVNIWSLALLREGFMTFLILLFFWFFLKFFEQLKNANLKKSFYCFFFVSVVFVLMSGTRAYVARILGVSFLIWLGFLVIKTSCYKNLERVKVVLLVIIISYLFVQLFMNEKLTLPLDSIVSKNSFESLNSYRNLDENNGRLHFYTGADIHTIKNALFFLPVGLTYTIFSVLPFEVKSFDLWLYFIFDTAFWYFLLFFIFLGTIFALRDVFLNSSLIFIFCFLMIVSTALVEGNFGNLLRHSVQFKAPLLIFAAYGLSKTFPEGFYLKYFETQKYLNII